MFNLITVISTIGLLVGMLVCFETGWRIGKDRHTRHPEGTGKGVGAVEAGVYGLLGLLIALTFSGAVSRFDDRRHMITEEANAIGTAYLRIDILSENEQQVLRNLFREYLDSRLETYRLAPDIEAAKAEMAHSIKLQAAIWSKAVSTCRDTGSRPDCMLLLPALNDMIDITTTRYAATRNHPPLVIFLLLGVLSLVGSLLAGYSMSENRTRSWLHVIVFTAMLSTAVYVIFDLEYPRLGFIVIDAADQTLIELRQSM